MPASNFGATRAKDIKTPSAPVDGPAPPRARRPRRRTARTALVVEADPVIRRVCVMAAEAAGFSAEWVDSGIAAVASARERPPDIILMDFQLPDVPWSVAMGWLRSNPGLRSTPIVVLTPRALDDADVRAVQPLASVRKPVSVDSIRQGIAILLD